MTSDPPKYRPLERFWPYAELPEQPTNEELASLDPDLHDALFGERPRPFSITLVFPALEIPRFAEALDLARASAEFRETGAGTSSAGNTSVIENGRGRWPNSASYRSGSREVSSSLVGCSGRSAYGQKRSRGRYLG